MEDEVTAAVVADPWPGMSIVPIADVAVMTLNQAYNYLHVEDLLLALPGRVGKRDRALEVVFFNEKGKELEVKFAAIRDLKRVRTRLGNDVVDFVMSRFYFQYPSQTRHEIQFVLSRVSSCLEGLVQGKTSLQNWAATFLQPPPPVQVHQVKEIILPWVCKGHWSLLVFQYDKVLHFDSSVGQRHHPDGVDADIIKWVSYAWQTLRGVENYDVTVVNQTVCQQSGNYECGHNTLRNALLYLKVINRIFSLFVVCNIVVT